MTNKPGRPPSLVTREAALEKLIIETLKDDHPCKDHKQFMRSLEANAKIAAEHWYEEMLEEMRILIYTKKAISNLPERFLSGAITETSVCVDLDLNGYKQ